MSYWDEFSISHQALICDSWNCSRTLWIGVEWKTIWILNGVLCAYALCGNQMVCRDSISNWNFDWTEFADAVSIIFLCNPRVKYAPNHMHSALLSTNRIWLTHSQSFIANHTRSVVLLRSAECMWFASFSLCQFSKWILLNRLDFSTDLYEVCLMSQFLSTCTDRSISMALQWYRLLGSRLFYTSLWESVLNK